MGRGEDDAALPSLSGLLIGVRTLSDLVTVSRVSSHRINRDFSTRVIFWMDLVIFSMSETLTTSGDLAAVSILCSPLTLAMGLSMTLKGDLVAGAREVSGEEVVVMMVECWDSRLDLRVRRMAEAAATAGEKEDIL